MKKKRVHPDRSDWAVWNTYQSNCKRKNIYFAIPRELFQKLIKQPCHYCGRPPANVYDNYWYNGLDRKDNSRGYYPKNVVTCCWACNSVKGKVLSYSQMKKIGRIMKSFWKNGGLKKGGGR